MGMHSLDESLQLIIATAAFCVNSGAAWLLWIPSRDIARNFAFKKVKNRLFMSLF